MKARTRFLVFAAIAGLLMFSHPLSGKEETNSVEELKDVAPRVFIDCRRCDRDFFREEITFVNYVRDRQEADIHVLITEQTTGSGGHEYTMAFIGLKDFSGIDNTLKYVSGPTDTWDETRKGMAEVLKKGLFPYIIKTPIAEYCSVLFRQKLKPTAVKDPWNFWVFSISLDSRLSGEEQRSSISLDANVSANRVTPEWKIRFGLSADYDERRYKYEDETIISTQTEKNFSGLVVKSLGEHWAVGGWVEANASTYSNLKSFYTIAPAIEYNFFPYSESTRRQLRALYKIGFNAARYEEETIFDKTSESLYNQSLTLTLEVREPWGSASTSLEGSHYFHDFSKNRLKLRGFLSFRIFKGFSMDVWGRYERIHDQIFLPKGEATLEEVLLRRKELATSYEYSISIGFRYTFGSVFTNVVNPRFGRTRFRGDRGR